MASVSVSELRFQLLRASLCLTITVFTIARPAIRYVFFGGQSLTIAVMADDTGGG